jgi:hypothetical protein
MDESCRAFSHEEWTVQAQVEGVDGPESYGGQGRRVGGGVAPVTMTFTSAVVQQQPVAPPPGPDRSLTVT